MEFNQELADLWGGWWRGGGEGGGLPTPLDFSTNSGWNFVPSLLESLWHGRRLFGGSFAVSRYCKMLLGENYLSYVTIEVYHSWNIEIVPISTTTSPNLPRQVLIDS
jgi:hypothetical protein